MHPNALIRSAAAGLICSAAAAYNAAPPGTVAVVAGSNAVAGTGTHFLTNFAAGGYISIGGETHRIRQVTNDTSLLTGGIDDNGNWRVSASGAYIANPAFAALQGAPLAIDQTEARQSPPPGQAAMPNQILIYTFDDNKESASGALTAPKFHTKTTLRIELQVETKNPAALATLPASVSAGALAATVAANLDALREAVEEAVLPYILNARTQSGAKFLSEIVSVRSANKYKEDQRVAGQCAIDIELTLTETFEPSLTVPLTQVNLVANASAGGMPNQGNTGNGVIGGVTVGAGAQLGPYAIALTSATSFTVTAPDDTALGSGTIGTAFAAGGISFLLSAGLIPFVAGDGFTVAVEGVNVSLL